MKHFICVKNYYDLQIQRLVVNRKRALWLLTMGRKTWNNMLAKIMARLVRPAVRPVKCWTATTTQLHGSEGERKWGWQSRRRNEEKASFIAHFARGEVCVQLWNTEGGNAKHGIVDLFKLMPFTWVLYYCEENLRVSRRMLAKTHIQLKDSSLFLACGFMTDLLFQQSFVAKRAVPYSTPSAALALDFSTGHSNCIPHAQQVISH